MVMLIPLFFFSLTSKTTDMQRALTVLAVACLLAGTAVSKRPKWHQLEGYTFERYVADFGRQYSSTEEYLQRQTIFYTKLKSMQAHNADGTKTWKRGVNMFTDMTPEEWKAYNKAYKSPNRAPPSSVHVAADQANGVPFPLEVDYRTWTSPRVLTDVTLQGVEAPLTWHRKLGQLVFHVLSHIFQLCACYLFCVL
ncbi:GPI-anchored surface protein, putative [Bodo saltans]|uniref:GPI-anchored surface protein, putative n=1 Tax=Bodo saltans TaxID=75058 RepID=A0A0S4JTH4_BODSA|nr:GPI-anchored surface protein, putative [Bodo saltans]|eukprot:CUG94120.1 GPI-anchored surface protein, putative [Bodo saltans]